MSSPDHRSPGERQWEAAEGSQGEAMHDVLADETRDKTLFLVPYTRRLSACAVRIIILLISLTHGDVL